MRSVLYTSNQLWFCHSHDGTMRVRDLASGACTTLHWTGTGPVTCLALSADGGMLVAACWDGTLSRWGLIRGGSEWVCNRTLTGHTEVVTCVAVSGNLAVSGGEDKTVRVWDLTTGVCLKVLEGHTADVCAVALSRDCMTAISGACDSTVKVWRIYE